MTTFTRKKKSRNGESEPRRVAEKTATTFVIANNHNLGKAAVNALELMHMLDGAKVKAPPSLVAKYPERLASIVLPQD